MFIEDKTFNKIDFTKTPLTAGEYDGCNFVNCNFRQSDLSRYSFSECEFKGCDLSLVKLNGTVLNDVRFSESKLLGIHFSDCNDLVLSMSFTGCDLSLSVFYKLKLKKSVFKDCNLQESDFTDADLSSSTFENCNLNRTVFFQTNLEKVDFRSSFNYSFDPDKNNIKKAKFSRNEVVGLLGKYDIEIE